MSLKLVVSFNTDLRWSREFLRLSVESHLTEAEERREPGIGCGHVAKRHSPIGTVSKEKDLLQ